MHGRCRVALSSQNVITSFPHFQKQATNKPIKTNYVSLTGTKEMTDPKDGGTASKAGGGGSPGDLFFSGNVLIVKARLYLFFCK